MILAKHVTGLSAGEEDALAKVEAFIDQSVVTTMEKDATARTFPINRTELSKHLQANSVDGLSLRVKAHYTEKARKAGWDITEDADNLILSAPLPKRGGRPKGSKNTPATVQPSAAPESAPAQTPAEPATV